MTTPTVALWDIFELDLTGPSSGNPYLDVTLEATFTPGHPDGSACRAFTTVGRTYRHPLHAGCPGGLGPI